MTREDAVAFLVSRRFSAPIVKQAQQPSAGGALKKWFGNLSTAQQGALIGALGGGGIGLVSSLSSDDKDRSWWRDSLTGALGGGAAGLGAGALIGALRDRMKTPDSVQNLHSQAGTEDTKEIAETKCMMCKKLSKDAGYPFLVLAEAE